MRRENQNPGSKLVAWEMPTDGDFLDAKALGDSISGKGWRPEVRPKAYIVRLVPSLKGRKPLVAFARHWCKTGEKTVPIVCGLPTGQPCFPHDEMQRAAGDRNPIDQQRVKEWEARPSYAVVIIDRENEKAGPIVWEFGTQVFDQIQILRNNARDGGSADPFDPGANGYDIFVTLKMEKGYKKYVIAPAQKVRPLAPDAKQVSAWIQAAPDLTAKFQAEDYAAQQESLGMSSAPTGGWAPPGRGQTVQSHLHAPDLSGGFADDEQDS